MNTEDISFDNNTLSLEYKLPLQNVYQSSKFISHFLILIFFIPIILESNRNSKKDNLNNNNIKNFKPENKFNYANIEGNSQESYPTPLSKPPHFYFPKNLDEMERSHMKESSSSRFMEISQLPNEKVNFIF